MFPALIVGPSLFYQQPAGVTSMPITAAWSTTSTSPEQAQADSKCRVKAAAKQADLAGALDWVCGSGGVNCGSIGGAHPEPTPAHANFAFDAYYQAHKTDG